MGRCSTCGEDLAPADRICPTCGTAVTWSAELPARIRRCPRCGYRGEGVAFFRRPGRIAILITLGMLTYGLGGLIYWLVRRKNRVCPSCGLGWEHSSRAVHAETPEEGSVPEKDHPDSLPSGGGKRRVLGVATILLAAFLFSMGIVETDLTILVTGAGTGAAGAVIFWWGWKALESRRDALMARLQRQVLLMADRTRGVLTVTEVAAKLDLSLEAAEKVLISMDDGFRVRSEITNEGLLLYEFPEIRHRHRLEGGPERGREGPGEG